MTHAETHSLDWAAHLPTDPAPGWGGPRGEPPRSVASDPYQRWEHVREACRNARHLDLPVDQIRRIEAHVRPDRQMRSYYGELDPLTVIALMWFQDDHGLRPTGLPDEGTLDALQRAWPELARGSARRLLRPHVLIPDGTPALRRYLRYRRAVLDLGGLVDDGHRAINVLVLRGAALLLGPRGLLVRYVGSDSRSCVTVSFWVEREGGRDTGEVVGVTARERPGEVRPVQTVGARRIPLVDGGHYVCDIDRDGPPVREARALVPRYGGGATCLPEHPPEIPPDGANVGPGARALVDTTALTWPRFQAELRASHHERASRGRWSGVRLTVLDASRLGSIP